MSISSEITRLQGAKADLKSAINAKIGTGTLIDDENIDEYADFVENISTGVDINGIIEQYQVAAGENISAGDFVEYINEWQPNRAENEMLTTINNSFSFSSDYGLSAIQLTDNKIFIAYHYWTSNAYRLRAVIATINLNNTTISLGTSIELNSSGTSRYKKELIKISNNCICVGFSYSTSNQYLCLTTCLIDNTTITMAGGQSFGSYSGYGGFSCVKINNTSILATYVKGISTRPDGGPIYSQVCSVNLNDGTMSVGTATQLDSNNIYYVITEKISNNGAIILYDSKKLTINIQDLLITIEISSTNSNITPKYYNEPLDDMCFLQDDKVFYVYGDSSSSYSLYGIIISIVNSIIEIGTPILLASSNNPGRLIQVTKLNATKVFISHSLGSETHRTVSGSSVHSYDYYLGGQICNISNTLITPEEDTVLNSEEQMITYFFGTALLEETDTIINICKHLTITQIGSYILKVKTLESSSQTINGIAAESGSAGDTIDVYVPNTSSN